MEIVDWQEEGEDMTYRFSVYEDVADLFWPGDYNHGNHDAETRVIQRMADMGVSRVNDPRYAYGAYRTPFGLVAFDSESGGMEWHSHERAPVEFVVGVVQGIQADMERHRKALR